MHQAAVDNVKTAITKDVVLAYADYTQEFEVYTNSSKFQLGVVILKTMAAGILQ
jgi:hypothetical protein